MLGFASIVEVVAVGNVPAILNGEAFEMELCLLVCVGVIRVAINLGDCGDGDLLRDAKGGIVESWNGESRVSRSSLLGFCTT